LGALFTLYLCVALFVSGENYPTSIKNVISKMTSSTQLALRNRISRMEIELPIGADFGLNIAKRKSSKLDGDDSDRIKSSNRDASRLIVEMFSGISLPTVVLFPLAGEARDARDLWAPTYRGQTLSFETPQVKGYGKLRSRRFTAEEQEQVTSIMFYSTHIIALLGPVWI